MSVLSIFEPPAVTSALAYATDQNNITVSNGNHQISFNLNSYSVTLFGNFPEGTATKLQEAVLSFLNVRRTNRAIHQFLTDRLIQILDPERTIMEAPESDDDEPYSPCGTGGPAREF